MTTDRKLKITFGILSLGILATLLAKLPNIPGGMILSGRFLGGMLLIGVLTGCLILAGLLTRIFRRSSFLTLFFITSTFAFLAFHYYLYSPKLTIIVPNGYHGEVNLVKSNVDNNILSVDSNGIGYLTAWTFDNTYLKPAVIQENGKSLDKNLVGFNSSTFFGVRRSCCIDGQQIESISFEIVPDSVIGKKQYYTKDLVNLIDKRLTLFSKPHK